MKICDFAVGSLAFKQNSTTKDPLPTKAQLKERAITLREFTPNYSAVIEPSEEYLKTTDNLAKTAVKLNIDSNGFISTGNNFGAKPARTINIIFFGGSTTETLYVNEIKRWTSILERELNSQSKHYQVKIHNAGVSGNHTMHSVLSLLAKGVEMQPDFVVLMHNMNDLSLLNLTGSYWKAPKTRSMIQTKNPTKNPESLLRLNLRQIKNWTYPNLWELLVLTKHKLVSLVRDRKTRVTVDEFQDFRDGKNHKQRNRAAISKCTQNF